MFEGYPTGFYGFDDFDTVSVFEDLYEELDCFQELDKCDVFSGSDESKDYGEKREDSLFSNELDRFQDLCHAPPREVMPENGFCESLRQDIHEEDKQDKNVSELSELTKCSKEKSTKLKKEFRSCGICKLCKRYFQRLDRHMLLHLDERPYPCTQCQESFRQHTHLLRHMQTHTRSQSFPCAYCKKVLTRKDKLKNHERFTCKVLREM